MIGSCHAGEYAFAPRKTPIFAHDTLLNRSSPPWVEVSEAEVDTMLVIALLTDYKTDRKLFLDEIDINFKPVFDHINDKYMIEAGDFTRPTARDVQHLNGGRLYNDYRKKPVEKLEELFDSYELPRPLPRP